MKVSVSWLNDYVPVKMDAHALADALTMVGLEVDSVTNRYEYLDRVVVGRIIDISAHPDSDHLQLCNVDAGAETVSVVCGAPNVFKNMIAPLALPGTILPDGSVLTKSVIRGQASEGMLCSEIELGLGTDSSGVLDLSKHIAVKDAVVGQKLVEVLSLEDYVLEIELTPNRPDCLSLVGIAREIAAIEGETLKYPDFTLFDKTSDIEKRTSVIIDAPDHCPRYAARLVEDVVIEPSPYWLQDRLLSIGQKPINNIVDITNFVMMELGQPLHAFDFDNLAENRIVVRTASPGEPFTTLDEKDRKLTEDMLMICDGQKPVAVGGVMGGLNSEIESTTKNVLIESACFDPVSIRRTSKALGLNTEASHRFERGVDPGGTINALNRAAHLMVELGKGRLVDGLIDVHPGRKSPAKISLSVSATNRLLGLALSREHIEEHLRSIEFNASAESDDTISVIVPSFRVDVSRPEDLMEEVARRIGYHHIPTTFPAMPAETLPVSRQRSFRNSVKQIVVGMGFLEVITYSFIHQDACDRLRLDSNDPRRNRVHILNPLSEEQSVMRTSMVPGLLETVRYNIAQQMKDLKLFEIGKIYLGRGNDELPDEREILAGAWTGSRHPDSWVQKDVPCDYFDIKGVVECLLDAIKASNVRFSRMPSDRCKYMQPGYTAQIDVNDTMVGLIGQIHPQVLKNYDIKQPVFLFEIDMDLIRPLIPEKFNAEPIPKYPFIARDLTLIVDKGVEAMAVVQKISDLKQKLVENIHIFDVYEGDKIPEGKKSISIRVTFRSFEETLEDKAVSLIHKKISDRLVADFNASLPPG